ncbi:ATP-binding protein [Agrobacterium sp. Azo12]|uniref:ATP-binding protein n=1 Tax=Agrobacterium sp. Azo12 TaxID=3031129 RepID=UPI0023D7DA08|nr:ATP-binding protein [Agrobacterium sp. Azo12]MDO5897906.1 ATP-binding protein [Agrobacterium sp. Azo12]
MNIAQIPNAEIARIRAMMPPDMLAKADRIAQINGRYIGLSRDATLKKAFDAMIASIAVIGISDMAKPDKRRIVALCGESGAGKTTALLTHTSECAIMQPYVNEDGNTIRPLLMMTAPSPCTPRLLAYEGLHAMGYPVRPGLKENEMWKLFRDVLKAHGVMWLVIDEAQHAVDASNAVEVTKIGNALKNLVQMPDWPVRIVLAGVAPLEAFLSRKQLANRCTKIPFGKMKGSTGATTMAVVTRLIIFEHAEMKTSLHKDEEFIQRLMHGCDKDFGTMVQMIRGAVELAIYADEKVITIKHFADCFETNTGRDDVENVFVAKDWEDIKPYNASENQVTARYHQQRGSRKRAR